MNSELRSELLKIKMNIQAGGSSRQNHICRKCGNGMPAYDLQDGFVEVHDDSLYVEGLPYHPNIIETVTALLEGAPEVYLGTRACVNKALNAQSRLMHQDNDWFREACPKQGLAMWIALNEPISLQIVPRVDRQLHHSSVWPQNDNLWHSSGNRSCRPDLEGSQEVCLTVEAGSVVLFSFLTPHCVMEKTAENTFSVLTIHFYHPPCTKFFRVKKSTSAPKPDPFASEFSAGQVYSLMDLINMCHFNTYRIHELMDRLLDTEAATNACCFEQISFDLYAQETAFAATSRNIPFESGQDDATSDASLEPFGNSASSEARYRILNHFNQDGRYEIDDRTCKYLSLREGDTVSRIKIAEGWAFGQILSQEGSMASTSRKGDQGWYPPQFATPI